MAIPARIACACALLAIAAARTYEQCELARELVSLGVRREQLSTWVCIAYHESRFDTAARNPHSGDHGLLQISELFWCGPGKACGVSCEALRDENIEDDVRCAQMVHEEHTRLQGDGFLAWVVYPLYCNGDTQKYLADCELDNVIPSNRAYPDPRSNEVYADIDKLKPPYFAVNALVRSKYKNNIVDYSQKKGRTNWLDFHVDDIDKLRLPVFDRPTTTTTTTTTTPSTTTTTTAAPVTYKPFVFTRPTTTTTEAPTTTKEPFTLPPITRNITREVTNPPFRFNFAQRLPTTTTTAKYKFFLDQTTEAPAISKDLPPFKPVYRLPPSTMESPSTTESIFDFYLNTRPSSLATYSFAPIEKRYKINIFSDGTTTPLPRLAKHEITGGARRNQLRRHIGSA